MERAELPLRFTNRVSINQYYETDFKSLIDIRTNKKVIKFGGDGYIAIIPEGKLLYCYEGFSGLDTYEFMWENKAAKYVLINQGNNYILYDISNVVTNVREFEDLGGVYSINNRKVVINETDVLDLETGDILHYEVESILPFFYDNVVSFSPTDDNKTFLIEYQPNNTEIKRKVVLPVELDDSANIRLMRGEGNNFYVAILDSGEKEDTEEWEEDMPSKVNIYEVGGVKTNLIGSLSTKAEDNAHIEIIYEHVLLRKDDGYYMFNVRSREYSTVKTNFADNIFYLPRLTNKTIFHTRSPYNAIITITDKPRIYRREFIDIRFNTTEEYLMLKCIIRVFLTSYIPDDVSNMIFNCINI